MDSLSNGTATTLDSTLSTAQPWLTSYNDVSKAFAGNVQAKMDHAWSIWTAMIGVRSMRDAMALQVSITQRLCEQVIADTSAMTHASSKMVERSMMPMNAYLAFASRSSTPTNSHLP
ncbi:MAG: phasin family protein [Pseudomonadota bacterium]|nr:phasin family protein [Pseudomonadota bacterium]